MTIAQKRKILMRIQTVEADKKSVQDAIQKIATNEFASATISTSGGSKSYTRQDMAKLTELLKMYDEELKSLRRMIFEEPKISIKRIITVYS